LLNILLSKKDINKEFFKSKENTNFIKEKILKLLYDLINDTNDLNLNFLTESLGLYKARIDYGNNHSMIKTILKQR